MSAILPLRNNVHQALRISIWWPFCKLVEHARLLVLRHKRGSTALFHFASASEANDVVCLWPDGKKNGAALPKFLAVRLVADGFASV